MATSVTSDSGMINNYVFFEMGVVLGGVKVEVGDVLYVEAERKHSKAGWTAVRWVWFARLDFVTDLYYACKCFTYIILKVKGHQNFHLNSVLLY